MADRTLLLFRQNLFPAIYQCASPSVWEGIRKTSENILAWSCILLPSCQELYIAALDSCSSHHSETSFHSPLASHHYSKTHNCQSHEVIHSPALQSALVLSANQNQQTHIVVSWLILFWRLSLAFSNLNPAKPFPLRLLWQEEVYHHPVEAHREL